VAGEQAAAERLELRCKTPRRKYRCVCGKATTSNGLEKPLAIRFFNDIQMN
jgi:hypothetical protein